MGDPVTAAYEAPTLSEVRTTEPEIAHATLVQGYSPTRPVRFSGNFDHFEFATSSVTAGPLTTATIRHSAATMALTEPYEPFIGGISRFGRLRFRTSREDVPVDREHAVRYSTDLPIAVSWDDVDLLVVMFPLQAVARAAAGRADTERSAFRFTSTAPASLALSRFWRATVVHVDRELRADGSALGYPLLRARTLELLVAAALTVFPNTTMTSDYLPGPGAVASSAVRRAIAFVDDNAGQPITVGEIASAAGVGVRGLQQAFLRHVGLTPMGYARRVRLERARADLQTADPAAGTTVRSVAAMWGFPRLDRFTRFYSQTFGVHPDQTLHS